MGDQVLRISLLVQRGCLCKECGTQIDGNLHYEPRRCARCEAKADFTQSAGSQASTVGIGEVATLPSNVRRDTIGKG